MAGHRGRQHVDRRRESRILGCGRAADLRADLRRARGRRRSNSMEAPMSDLSISESIDRLSAVITADPAKAKSRPTPATARLTEGLKCEVTGLQPGQQMKTDMPPAMGGEATAPNPGWYLRGAIASCAATVIAMRAAKVGIKLETLEVTVDAESDHRGILGLDPKISAGQHLVRMKVKIQGNAPAQTLRELVAWADAHSPVGCTLRDGPQCSLEIEVGSS